MINNYLIYIICFKHDWKNFFFMKANSVCLGSIPSNTFLPSNSKSKYLIELKEKKLKT